jgi:hypothetical protein
MASRFWVGGSGTWGSTASWSASSGGASGASVPTAADDVFFDAASDGVASTAFTVTLGAAATCLSLNFSAVDQNVTFSGAFTLSVVGNLVLSPTKTISVTGITSLAMTATTTRTITAGGGTLTGGITFNGAAGTWTLQDALTVTGTVSHTQGTIAFNGKTFTAATYSNTGTSARALNFTTAGSKFSISATTTSTVWSIASTTGLTITSPTAGSVDIIGSANITRTISTLALAEASSLNFNILATAGTITATASNTFRDLVVNCTGATFSNIAITVYGNLSYLGGTWAAGANLLTLAASSGSLTITGTGGAFDFPITYNSSPTGAAAYTLASNVTVGATAARTFTHQQGTLNLSSYTLTVYGTFNGSSGATRTLNFGTGYIDLTLNGSTTTTIWDTTTVTAFTVTNATTGSVRVKGSGTLIRNINTGGLSEANSLSFEFLSTAGTITLTNLTSRIKNLTINCPGTTVSNAVIACYGNFTYTAGTLAAGTNTLSFLATSGTQAISSAGTLDFPVTFAGTTVTYSLSSNLSVGTTTARTVTLTTGTIELNSYSFTIFGVFSSAGTSTRKIQMSGSGGKIVLSLDTATTVWNTSTITGLTTDGNVLVQLTGGGAVTKTISAGALSEANAISFRLSTTAGTVAFTASNTVENLTIDNNSFTLSNIAITIYGSLTVSGTSPTLTAGTNAWTFAATSGTKTITTSSETLDFPLTFNGAGGTWQLQDALTMGSTRTLTFNAGTIDLNIKTLTTSIFSIASGSTKNVTVNAGSIYITGSGTAWNNADSANFTTSTGISYGYLVFNSASAKTFAGGGVTYQFDIINAGAGALSITGGNTFRDIYATSLPSTITLPAGVQNTTILFSLAGTAGNLVTLNSSTAGTRAQLYRPPFMGDASTSYMDIKDIEGQGVLWTATYSTDSGNNLNWTIYAAGIPVPGTYRGMFAFF